MSEDIIIIPDVHGRKFWREAVEQYPDADTIFLGDYLDPYPGEGISSEDAIANLEEIIAYTKTKPNVTLLMGNHDLHYLCNFGEACRLDYASSAKIHFLLMDNLWIFRLAALREVNGKNVIFTHAPILTEWIEEVGETTNLQLLVNRLNGALRKIMKEPWEVEDYIGQISEYRGGFMPFGSPVWADLREVNGNIIPTADFAIFAHTQQDADPIITDTYACLDCRKAFRLTPNLELIPTSSKPFAETPTSIAIHNAIQEGVEMCRRHQDNERIGVNLFIWIKGHAEEYDMLFMDDLSIGMYSKISREDFERLKHFPYFRDMEFNSQDGAIINETELETTNLDFVENFLTDYILFLNPDAKPEEIVATLGFDCYIDYDKVDNPEEYEAYRIDYLGDGSTQSAKSWSECERFLVKSLEE